MKFDIPKRGNKPSHLSETAKQVALHSKLKQLSIADIKALLDESQAAMADAEAITYDPIEYEKWYTRFNHLQDEIKSRATHLFYEYES